MIWQLDLLLLTLVVICAFGTVTVRGLLSATIIFAAYSFLMCLLYAEMGAVDVAFTEAVVGAGISTIFFIAALFRSTKRSKLIVRGVDDPQHFKDQGLKMLPLALAFVTGALLFYGMADFPPWGDPGSPPNTHVSAYYIKNAVKETHVPNLVTAVLGDYRGYDTMFELVVIYCAGVSVVSILKQDGEH
jgi:multicomponent Na+:H+ antiporter subunit B